ncbi:MULTISPECIES: anti-sigma F factor antagonist [unclassified Candidatus Frackibacter]|uniref:anti-sigma F factor antagonist n=1 Tax=unclassified Candidatus Frackibacter TaxID=2648818 RepID=UPI000798043F|nr:MULTISPECIES: anti-sigma F factor antagonist [unclassified Candidatus Frackibacter]KXS43667.1 MAG: stage II sporulation protein AA (anti-sigma F factor antagonist) [Candidatus Frackibacter sp. T328-2]SDC01922.1 anti-anti-sigma regulatory factor, SpoIIAA [Candidatus Frackibacter sp. WG11]SEM33126.1 anti-anti-sigma regulatory factor, SpoIIAA [Candidatus Frackibacter sp. WG12]SFL38120.1 anti-anti-sigma regulatory factor, SpoIIAA [Candidatus Frackibacter sp. WG13]
MSLEIEREGVNLIVRVYGDLDLHTVDNLRMEIEDRLDQEVGIKNMILNLEDVDFIDSSGLGFIIGRYKRISNHGGELKLINVKNSINKVFELSGILKIVDVFPSEREALKAV